LFLSPTSAPDHRPSPNSILTLPRYLSHRDTVTISSTPHTPARAHIHTYRHTHTHTHTHPTHTHAHAHRHSVYAHTLQCLSSPSLALDAAVSRVPSHCSKRPAYARDGCILPPPTLHVHIAVQPGYAHNLSLSLSLSLSAWSKPRVGGTAGNPIHTSLLRA
ncbi:hypothetical protein CCUS01_16957, partial [Colletotrichum cuscutae]